MIWKILAVVFILVSIVEGGIIYWWWNAGTEYIENENECAVNICDGYDAYQFDYDNICYCYNDGIIEKQRYVE